MGEPHRHGEVRRQVGGDDDAHVLTEGGVDGRGEEAEDEQHLPYMVIRVTTGGVDGRGEEAEDEQHL